MQMMLLLVVGASVVFGVCHYYLSCLRHNIAEAKRSGFNYVVVLDGPAVDAHHHAVPQELVGGMARVWPAPGAAGTAGTHKMTLEDGHG
ncbi:hypothetical protein TCAP_00206 [Tolypocladium capitatum]|uniref:Uncharacterized protein n=1 Tax=Tolypocladium capitatum TaxID=45235 RepID=A0A2K3QQR1_9HYPO|nr:hypothetical protein TCAP_00206 [Tolypocladium capitatum]